MNWNWFAGGWSPKLARGLEHELLRSTQVTTVAGMGWWLKHFETTNSIKPVSAHWNQLGFAMLRILRKTEVGGSVTAARATSKILIISLTCWPCYPCPCASPWGFPCLPWTTIWWCTSYCWALCLSSDCWRWWDVSTSLKYCCMCCQPPLMLF